MAFGLPAQYNEIFPIGPIERQTAIETAKAALEEMGLAYEFFGDGMRARIKGSFNSWGEVLSIVVDEYGCLHVNSRCRGL